MMTRFLSTTVFAALLAAVPASSVSSQDVESEFRGVDPDLVNERDALSSEPGTLVVLRGLDKVTARTRDFEIVIGETVEFGALSITAQYCRKRPPEETPETYGFFEVVDRRTDGFGVDAEGETIFSGWMFASRPAQNPLEHAVYDFWVIDCRV
jgi:hypothetical protein